MFNKVFIYLFIYLFVYLFIYFPPILSSHSYSFCSLHNFFQFLLPFSSSHLLYSQTCFSSFYPLLSQFSSPYSPNTIPQPPPPPCLVQFSPPVLHPLFSQYPPPTFQCSFSFHILSVVLFLPSLLLLFQFSPTILPIPSLIIPVPSFHFSVPTLFYSSSHLTSIIYSPRPAFLSILPINKPLKNAWKIIYLSLYHLFQVTASTIRKQWMQHSSCQTLYHRTCIIMLTFGTDWKLTAGVSPRDTPMFT